MNPQQVQQYLGGMNYPASKQELIAYAQDQDTPEEVLITLENITDRDYNNTEDLNNELAKIDK